MRRYPEAPPPRRGGEMLACGRIQVGKVTGCEPPARVLGTFISSVVVIELVVEGLEAFVLVRVVGFFLAALVRIWARVRSIG